MVKLVYTPDLKSDSYGFESRRWHHKSNSSAGLAGTAGLAHTFTMHKVNTPEFKAMLREGFDALLDGLQQMTFDRSATGFTDVNRVGIKAGDLIEFYIDDNGGAFAINSAGDDLCHIVAVVIGVEGEFYTTMPDVGFRVAPLGNCAGRCRIVGNVFDNTRPLYEASEIFSGRVGPEEVRPIFQEILRQSNAWAVLNADFERKN